MRVVSRVAFTPSHIVQRVASAIFIPTALCATTSGKLPFGLGGQTEVLTCQGVQLADKCLTVVPCYSHNRPFIAFLKVRGIVVHHLLPQLLCHLSTPYIVTAQCNLMGLINITGILLLGSTHREGSALYLNHLERYITYSETAHVGGVVGSAKRRPGQRWCGG